jgi:hypothetical protein
MCNISEELVPNTLAKSFHLEPPGLEEEPGRETYTHLTIIKDERAVVRPYPGNRRERAQRESHFPSGRDKYPIEDRPNR